MRPVCAPCALCAPRVALERAPRAAASQVERLTRYLLAEKARRGDELAALTARVVALELALARAGAAGAPSSHTSSTHSPSTHTSSTTSGGTLAGDEVGGAILAGTADAVALLREEVELRAEVDSQVEAGPQAEAGPQVEAGPLREGAGLLGTGLGLLGAGLLGAVAELETSAEGQQRVGVSAQGRAEQQ